MFWTPSLSTIGLCLLVCIATMDAASIKETPVDVSENSATNSQELINRLIEVSQKIKTTSEGREHLPVLDDIENSLNELSPTELKDFCRRKIAMENEYFTTNGSSRNGPGYRPGHGPSYGPAYKPSYGHEYKPSYGHEYKPSYGHEYKPSYGPSHGPEYKPGYRPEYEHGNKPGYGPVYGHGNGPEYGHGYGPGYGNGYGHGKGRMGLDDNVNNADNGNTFTGVSVHQDTSGFPFVAPVSDLVYKICEKYVE